MAVKRESSGFTLIELMITVAVIAILSAIALPSYSNYVRRAHVADAQKAIANSATDLEQIFADRRSYPAPTDTTFSLKTTPKFDYTYVRSTDGRGYVLAANGAGQLAGYFLVMNSSDTKCKCEKCGTNPLSSVTAIANACPSGSVPW